MENVLWKWVVVMCLDIECFEFVITVWYKVKFYDFKILVGASNQQSCLWWSVSLAYGNLTRTDDDWKFIDINKGNSLISTGTICLLDLISGLGEGKRPLILHILFWGEFSLGSGRCSSAGKEWGYLQNMEFSLKQKKYAQEGFLEPIEILFMFWREVGRF